MLLKITRNYCSNINHIKMIERKYLDSVETKFQFEVPFLPGLKRRAPALTGIGAGAKKVQKV